MKKSFFSAICLLFIFLATNISCPLTAKADGMGFNPYSETWDFIVEKNQQALINYDHGVQKMVLSIGAENSGKDFVWLFPIPAEAADVKLEILSAAPYISGQSISDRAKLNLKKSKLGSLATQFYTAPYILLAIQEDRYSSRGHMSDGFVMSASLGGSGSDEPEQDVVVYQHLEKGGMVSEVLSAKTADGLKKYFESKNLKLNISSLPVLSQYIGKNFSFIASWSQSANQNTDNGNSKNGPEFSVDRGVYVTFPTKNIYFPLILTSVYGKTVVPAEIRIVGKVSPKVYKEIKAFVKTDYFDNGEIAGMYMNFNGEKWIAEDFLNGKNGLFTYTKVSINAPADLFVKDLTFTNFPALKYYLANLFGGNIFIGFIVLTAICSILAALLAGFIFLKPLRKKPFKFVLIGLSNLLTIFGPIILTMLLNAKNEALPGAFRDNQRLKKYITKRRLSFVFFVVWAILIIPLGLPAVWFVISRSLDLFRDYYTRSIDITASVFILFFLIVPFLFFKQLSRIDPQDVTLFKELKKARYSKWTFLTHQRAVKFMFLSFFSVFFVTLVFIFEHIFKIIL